MQFATKLISSVALATIMASASVLPRQAGDYTLVFTGQEAAVQGTDFITFALFETAAECTAFCDSIPTCGFANSYHDNNGKGGTPLLTCSVYASCYGEEALTNTGGQTQPDGSVNFITDSDGFCKVVAPADPPTPTEPTEPTDPEPTEPTEPTTPEAGDA